jgi:hypothetical protein
MTKPMQDIRKTVLWHNVWMGLAIGFLLTTVLFAGLFGGYYSVWKNEPFSVDTDDTCFEEIATWTYDDGVDPTIHAVVWYNGHHRAVLGNTVTHSPCILKLYDTLRANGYVYPPSSRGRMTVDYSQDLNPSETFDKCLDDCNTNVQQYCNDTYCIPPTETACDCPQGGCDQRECPTTRMGSGYAKGKDIHCGQGVQKPCWQPEAITLCTNCYGNQWETAGGVTTNKQCPVKSMCDNLRLDLWMLDGYPNYASTGGMTASTEGLDGYSNAAPTKAPTHSCAHQCCPEKRRGVRARSGSDASRV